MAAMRKCFSFRFDGDNYRIIRIRGINIRHGNSVYLTCAIEHFYLCFQINYRICSRNLRTFFSTLAAEKSGCVKYADFFVDVLIWVLF